MSAHHHVAAQPKPGSIMHESGIMMSPKAAAMLEKVKAFVETECIPAQKIWEDQLNAMKTRWEAPPAIEEDLKKKAKALGLWNMFLTEEYGELGPGLTTMEYAVICETLGRSGLASTATNCAAPDTGNMELLAKFASPAQKEKWLKPLMNAEIRSAFTMTEPDVASSDATNLNFKITKTLDGKHYILNGRKHWISNSSNPKCELYIVVGKTDDMGGRHTSHSVVLVPKYTPDRKLYPGLKIIRHMTVFGYDDAPHGHDELLFENLQIPVENLVLGEGRGFDVLQGRLGGGRIHHCMRTLGVADRALELFVLEATNPKKRPFNKLKGEQGKIQWDLTEARIELEMCKRLVYYAASAMDQKGFKDARREIAMCKIKVPRMACNIIDSAIQVYGGLGISQGTELAKMWAHIRHLRFADGPDEAHSQQLARSELSVADKLRVKYEMYRQREAELRAKL
ncbi:hypothetical protein SmJEL517_g06002 [Synchytrium microbalum]|uniref:Acyl-CoA dehydrogenase n=1 Tax=Synchytrium microbalum TaxID=1806994 RepID=A0A507BYL9_9FUNG|nr:uncharacterized protein SmJEL517_g06002 [Synchytrium microbalum]TPX30435.1 hypothetical protein SmJEL517_g06002 [Synchytrium microbalum]